MNSSVEAILLAALAAASAVMLVYWGAVAIQVARTVILLPSARRGLRMDPGSGADLPAVCIIVPAHNEESCIATVAGSLLAQDYPHERLRLVFVLDRCTDQTRARLDHTIADSPGRIRVDVREIRACPDGWVGKSHAVWTGATETEYAAASDILLFVDADTRLDPGLVRAAVTLLQQRGLGLLSLMSTLTYDHWFEGLIQPAAGLELMRQYPLVRANSHSPREVAKRPFANGQFIMMRREEYTRTGGHEAVRTCVLEDVEMARLAARNGVATGVLLDRGMLHCRMYDSFAALRRGWKRIYTESANRKPRRLRAIAWRVFTIGVALPALAAGAVVFSLLHVYAENDGLARAAAWLGASALAVWLGALAWTNHLGGIPLRWTLSFPIGSWIVGCIMKEAARDLEQGKPTEWGGLTFHRDRR